MLWQFQMGRGVHLPLVLTCFLYALVFPYIFLLFDCFEWVLIDHIEKCRGHSALWQFQMGGSIIYIFLLFDCFAWALIDRIEKHRGHSALWQFRMGGRGVNRQIYPKSARFELVSKFCSCFTELFHFYK